MVLRQWEISCKWKRYILIRRPCQICMNECSEVINCVVQGIFATSCVRSELMDISKSIFILISFITFICSLFVVVYPEWFKMTNFDNLFGSKITIKKGIWMKCVSTSPGSNDCDPFEDPVYQLPGAIIGCRKGMETVFHLLSPI